MIYSVAPYVSFRETGQVDWASDLVRRMKVGDADPDEIEELAIELVNYIVEQPGLYTVDAVVPMPRRRPDRPNDLELLAEAVAEWLSVEAPRDWLVRVARPRGGFRKWHRTRHTAEEHAESMAVAGPDDFDHVLVLDNVLTTGGTMEGAFLAIERDSSAEPVGLTVLYEPKRFGG